MAIREMPPRGHYLAQEVGFLAGVSGPMIGQWAKNGYIRSSQSQPGESPRVYSFQDVAEAMVVHELRERGAAYEDLREAIQELRDRFGVDWPLSYSREQLATYGVPGKHRIGFRDRGTDYDIGRGWQVMDGRDLQKISQDLHRGGWAVRRLKNLRYVEVDPDRLSGTPTIKGRRVAARSVADLADSGRGGVAILRDEYDLTEAQIKDAQRWWKEARRLAAA